MRDSQNYIPQSITQDLEAISSLIPTCLPCQPDVDIESVNVSWLNGLFSHGFPNVLTERLISRPPFNPQLNANDSVNSQFPELKSKILRPSWEMSDAGRTFYRLLLWTGFKPYDRSSSQGSSSSDDHESPAESMSPAAKQAGSPGDHTRSSHYDLRSTSKKLEREVFLSEDRQQRLARTVAQHRVYNMRYLSKDRLWGPFLPIKINHDDVDQKGKGKQKLEDFKSEDVDQDDPEDDAQVWEGKRKEHTDRSPENSLRILREIRDFGVPLDEDDDSLSSEDEEDEDYDPAHQNDDDLSPVTSDFDIHPSQLPVDRGSEPYPTHPHRLFPDYVFLSAARTVVETNLREIMTGDYGPNHVLFRPWFTHTSAKASTEDLFRQIDDTSVSDRRGGLNLLRMGSAPGFWDGKGTKEGWLRVGEDVLSAQNPSLNEDDNVDGWDWAGVEGKWTRAVTWMDYRDLLEHSLRNIPPLASHDKLNHHIDDTRRVFHMNLRIKGYSRAVPPTNTSKSTCGASTSSNEPDPLEGLEPLEKLVYALPIIHVEGDYRSSDGGNTFGDTHLDSRRINGTVRMIGDGAVWWDLVTSFESGEREWVMAGVQIGEIGSALGVVGLWTGAEHERGDPIGATWTWRT
ncbi:hypothetical protein K435DRAFT_783647, partial [Dendrothele bispora CBS 962.96]